MKIKGRCVTIFDSRMIIIPELLYLDLVETHFSLVEPKLFLCKSSCKSPAEIFTLPTASCIYASSAKKSLALKNNSSDKLYKIKKYWT